MLVSKIAIQGDDTSFHADAAYKYFIKNNIVLIKCISFNDVFKSLQSDKADYGIIAIENSIAGAITHNYNLLSQYQCYIIGEIYILINLYLLSLYDTKINNIEYVQSHDMAIKQCELFLNQYPFIKKISKSDTSSCAKEIFDKKLINIAAIANYQTALKYKLHILSSNIQSNKNNYTRFLIISKKKYTNNNNNKSSIVFTIKNQTKCLFKIISILEYNNIKIDYLQLMPKVGFLHKYQFYIDLSYENYNSYLSAINKIKYHVDNISILGEYIKFKIKKNN